jgi:hypothetical protein
MIRYLPIFFSLVIVLSLSATVWGDPATSPTTNAASQPTTPPQEQHLIDQLNADDWRARQAAEDGLVAMGQQTRGEMLLLTATGTAEQRTRAQSVLARLDVAAANSPTLVTLHMKDANPRDIFSAIAKQAGVDLAFFPENLWSPAQGVQIPSVSIDLDHQPFWSAIEQAGQASASRVQTMNNGNGNKLTVQQSNLGEDWLAGPRFTRGQFTVMPMQISRNQTVTFSPSASKSSNTEMQFQLLVDPKVTVVSVQYCPKLTEALDDKGNSLVPPQDRSQGEQGGPALTFQLSTPLEFPNDGFTKLASLKGTISVAVASRVEHLDLPDVKSAVNQPKRLGDWTFVLESCDIGQRDGNYAVKVTVPSRMVDANAVYSMMSQIQLIDAAGNSISSGYNSGSGDMTHYEIKKTFTAPDVIHLPVRLKWDVPVETKEKQIPFEFKDLPLPTP